MVLFLLLCLLFIASNALNTNCQKWKEEGAKFAKWVRWCYDCYDKTGNTGICIAPTGVHCNDYFSMGPHGPPFGCTYNDVEDHIISEQLF